MGTLKEWLVGRRKLNLMAVMGLVHLLVLLLGIQQAQVIECLGVNWGTQAIHQLPPKTVVRLLQDNGINKVKLFDADFETMSALAGTNIEVMVAIPNDMLETISNYKHAKDWVSRNVSRFSFTGGVNIKYVAVGNEPFLKAYNGSFDKTTVPALKNIQNALNDAGYGSTIKATVPLNADVYESPTDNPVPSAGRFRPDITSLMTDMISFLSQNDAPFTVNIYPFLSLYYGKGDFPIDYAFFDGNSKPVEDNGIQYTNVFDANYDTLVSALKAINYGNLPVMVGEVGWPTDGDKDANFAMAIRFYNGLLPRLAGKVGTPLRPGEIEVYLFGLLDEDAKSIAPGNFERHWGIFKYDGQPKFPMDLTGQNQPGKYLVGAKDVQYLQNQWCMLNPTAINTQGADLSQIGENVKYACERADCTPLGVGCSCASLDANANVSYAFNVYFQTQSQNPEACDFNGLATITTQNISQGNCNFTIQIATSDASPRRTGTPTLISLGFFIMVAYILQF